MYQQPLQTQLLSISYRNGVYQGYFHRENQTREGFGLIYTTDNPMVMGSSWRQDRANQQTFVFYNHAHYTYGYWSNSIPHGFNAVRMDKIVIMGFYQMGVIKGRLLVIYEHYNLAIVLEKGEADNQFVEVLKGDIFSDEDFNNFIRGCNWPEFQDKWKTLIKFMATSFVGQQGQENNQRPKLRLVNKQYYRFGYNEGVAIVFDDQYRIVSIGLHKKATLKSLGVRFPKQNFVEEGNFNAQSQIFAFNYGHRPDGKIGKVYSNYLLKCTEFVNKYLNNPAKIFINYLEDLIKSNLFRRLLAGQITTRKLDTSYGTPPQTNRFSTLQKEPIKNQQTVNFKNQQMQKIRQQKKRLQTYKKQLFDTINKKSRDSQRDLQESLEEGQKRKMRQQMQNNLKNGIVHKPPVELALRNSRKKTPTEHSRNRSRSPIFTPDHQSRSPSPSAVSPFKERMRSKIFYENKERGKKYSYTPIQQQLYPRHSAVNMKKYNSPHQQLQFSPSRGLQNNQQVIPISVQRQNKMKNRQNDFQRKRQLQKELERQKLLQQQRQQLQAQMQKQREKLRKQAQQQRKKQKATATPKIKKQSTGSISFRNPYHQKETQIEFSNTNVPNIIITNQHKSKSKSPMQKKIIEPKLVSPENQIYERINNKKNNIYLKQNFGQEPMFTNQLKKQIKGNTYLQKYNKTKTPEKAKIQKNDTESKKYNKVIKTFNENNKIYQKISSPEKKKPAKTLQFEEQYKEPKQKYIQSSPIVKKFNESTPTKKKYQYIYE